MTKYCGLRHVLNVFVKKCVVVKKVQSEYFTSNVEVESLIDILTLC